MPVPGWRTVLISALLAASCLGASGQEFEQSNLGRLVFLKSSAAGEAFNLELVAYEPNGTYLFGIDLSPATPPGATIQTIQGLAVDYSGLLAVCYGVYSTSAIPKLIVADVFEPKAGTADPKAYLIDMQVVFHASFPLPSGCQLDTNSDPTLAVGYPQNPYNASSEDRTVFAILLCGSTFEQYLGAFDYKQSVNGSSYGDGKLTYLRRTAVSPVISQIFFVAADLFTPATVHANAVSTSVHLKQYAQILRFPSVDRNPSKLGRFEVAYSTPLDQCAVTISSPRRVYALCYEASAGFESEVKIITSGRPSKVIRPIHPGMEFVGLATSFDSSYVYLIHVDEIATNGKGGPDTVEVISKKTGRTVYFWKVLRVWTAAWPAVIP